VKALGHVFKYGDNVDTDVIIPARYLNSFDAQELASHAMVDIDPDFAKKVQPGDMIVANKNFGCGSSREHAPLCLKTAGVSCVIAETFARIFYRNAINIGLPIIECPEAARGIEAGDEVEVDFDSGKIYNRTKGTEFQGQPFPEFMQKLIKAGGLVNYTNSKKKKNLLYKSTRNAEKTVTASEAILKGLAEDGGLFVPAEIPKLDVTMEELKDMSYQETAYAVMKQFLTDFTEEELKYCIDHAYDEKFDTETIAPLAKVGDTYYLELFHGATIAFKDMALSILPHLLTTAAKNNNVTKDIVILTATSGDTGKAALAGFADVPGTRIIVFYPKDGVSRVQELQMVTQKGKNTSVVAIHGNFDNAQSGVKALFEDKELERELNTAGYQFSSANSINIGRLVPQIVYYVYAYAKLVQNGEIKTGEQINVTVPTGNFGNILAAYYAKQMGVPIDKLICASNENKVLFDFFRTGEYDRNREFILTSSPSMDILISSNLERLIYSIAGQDAEKNTELMRQLKEEGCYKITAEMRKKLNDFEGGYATEEETKTEICETYRSTGYVMDTHTAVAAHVCRTYREKTGDNKKMLVISTASPYKFTKSVMTAIDETNNTMEESALFDGLKKISGMEIPDAIEEIRNAEILHTGECGVDKMKETVRKILGIEV